ncbi:MAG: ABC transporter ATP-binding protein [Emergencia sp.]
MKTLELDNLTFAYEKKVVLKDMNCSFESGKITAITGKSGAGKTTLLSLISGLAEPKSGRILVNGENLSQKDKAVYRSRDIGVIFQSFNLLTKLTAVENVELSMEISGVRPDRSLKGSARRKAVRGLAYEYLDKVGITREEADRRVLKLSGGQQQRVAIARAISYNPDIILADEPTGNLDEETQAEIIDILKNLARQGKCVIIVTHSSAVADAADVRLNIGK